MKTGLSLVELATELERQRATKKDYYADGRRLHLEATAGASGETPGVVLRGVTNDSLQLRPIAHQQLASTLGIPKPYYDRMLTEAPDLLAKNANRWLGSDGPTGNREGPGMRMVRTIDGEVRALLSDQYRPLDNADLAEAVLPRLSQLGATVESSQITESRFYLKAITDRIRGDVKKGDTVQAGVVVSNSEVGQGSLRVEALDYWLACLNGMITGEVVRKTHLGRRSSHDALENAVEFFKDDTRTASDKAFFLQLRDTVSGMFDQAKFNRRIGKYRLAAGQVIVNDVPEVVEVVARRMSLTQDEQSSVLSHLIKSGDLSQYGLANAITRAAQDVESYDRSTELEAVGGDVIALPPSQWHTLAGVAA